MLAERTGLSRNTIQARLGRLEGQGVLVEVPPQVAMTPDHDARLAEQAQPVPPAAVVRVLDMLASELGGFLGTRTLSEVRAEMQALGPWQGERPAAPG